MKLSHEAAKMEFERFCTLNNIKVYGGRLTGAVEIIRIAGIRDGLAILAPYITGNYTEAALNLIESKYFRKNKNLIYNLARQIDSGEVIFDKDF